MLNGIFLPYLFIYFLKWAHKHQFAFTTSKVLLGLLMLMLPIFNLQLLCNPYSLVGKLTISSVQITFKDIHFHIEIAMNFSGWVYVAERRWVSRIRWWPNWIPLIIVVFVFWVFPNLPLRLLKYWFGKKFLAHVHLIEQ